MLIKKREDIVNVISSIQKRLKEIDAKREQLVQELNALQVSLADGQSEAMLNMKTFPRKGPSKGQSGQKLPHILLRGEIDILVPLDVNGIRNNIFWNSPE